MKVYDINIGHYVQINEDDKAQGNVQPAASDDGKKDDAQTQETQPTQKKSVSSNPDIMQLNADIEKKVTEKQTSQEKLKQQLADVIKKLEGVYGDSEYVETEVSPDVISMKKKILDDAKKYDEDIYRLNMQLLDKISKLHEGVKYDERINRYLNESNIHGAKVYLNNFVGGEGDGLLITGLKEFNKTFYGTKLLYGKDKSGYFVICLDQEDFNAIYGCLMNIGYDKDVIIQSIMPQILDRVSMV